MRMDTDSLVLPASYEGLFRNLHDWIFVIGVGEDGALTFETVNPPSRWNPTS